MEQLKPIVDRKEYHVPAQRSIEETLYSRVFGPLLRMFNSKREASKASFLQALRSGKLWYSGGVVTGQFSAALSKYLRELGGEWDKSVKGFRIGPTALGTQAVEAARVAREREAELKKKIKKHLDAVNDAGLVRVDVHDGFNLVVADLDHQFKKTTADSITVTPQLGEAARRRLAERYTNNLDLYVEGWEEEAVARLRKKIEQGALAGFRAEALEGLIKAEWGVSRRKAAFLARQETSLLVSKFREERYKEAGIRQYRWETSHDERVRHDHKELNGRVFSFDDPPITDRATGAKNNPGEDFNCRCLAIPLLKGVKK